jgi:hypothetical protein
MKLSDIWCAAFFLFGIVSSPQAAVIDFETAFEPFGTIRHVETLEGFVFDPAVLVDTITSASFPLIFGAASSGTRVLVSTTTGETIISGFLPGAGGTRSPFDFVGAFYSGFLAPREVTVEGFTQTNVDFGEAPDFSAVFIAPNSNDSDLVGGAAGNTGLFVALNFENIVRVDMRATGGSNIYIDDFTFLPAGSLGAVPLPAAVWLFGSPLGVLGWMRRRPT